MQNQNVHSWPWAQGSSGSLFAGAQPVLPSAFPSAGADQNPLLPGYHQMYGNSPLQQPDYAQWTSAQLQQWQQWQQWQEKYQQWQAQYGKKYAESLAAMSQNPNATPPGLPSVPTAPKNFQKSPPSVPNPPLPTNSQPVPPPPPEEEKPPPPAASGKDASGEYKNGCQDSKEGSEELSEAEKTFDIQFKQWEGQFNAWKKENQDHPDKAQYKEYEKKWETWREQLLQRREQMRKKRLSQVASDTGSVGGRNEEAKRKSAGPGPGLGQTKSVHADYSYSSQAMAEGKDSFPGDVPKFENKQVFEKPSLLNQGVPGFGFNQRGNSDEGRNYFSSPGPGLGLGPLRFGSGHFSGVGDIQSKPEFNKPPPFPSSQNSNRNQGGGQFANPGGNFVGSQVKSYSLGPNFKSGNLEASNDDSFNLRNRISNLHEAPPFEEGKFENFNSRQRFGDRHSGVFGPPQRFYPEKFDKFRNGKNFGFQRYYDHGRDKDSGASHNSGKSGSDDVDELGQGPGIRSSEPVQNSKPKVPSLFDITVERPPGLKESNSEWKPKIWEKADREDYGGEPAEGRSKEREPERDRDDRSRGNNGARGKTFSPWMEPWEYEKMNCANLQEGRNRDRGGPTGEPWFGDVSRNREIDKAELSGYVGNILAKLGHLNAIPPNSGNARSEAPDAGSSLDRTESGDAVPRFENPNGRTEGGDRKFGGAGDDLDDRPPALAGRIAGHPRSQNRSGSGQGNAESTKNLPESKGEGEEGENGSEDVLSAPRSSDCFGDESARFSLADVDERGRFGNRRPEPEEGTVEEERSAPRGAEEITAFGRDDLRNFARPFSATRGDRRSFANEEKFFNRDEGRAFARAGREDRGFAKCNPRDDADDRFGGGRSGRRNFERFDRDEREIRGFGDRFPRTRDRALNEPAWNPQVFDYSQGRPLRILAPEKGFKISTVVDYSHGENKQTFDYGHGDLCGDKREVKSFDYGHGAEFPTVIDYGHGVKIDSDSKKDRLREGEPNFGDRGKAASAAQSSARRSRSPKGRLRSRSRSPSSRHKGGGSVSPPFKDKRFKGRDGSGRHAVKRGQRNSEEKSSPGGNEVSKPSFDVTTVLVEDLICRPGRDTRPNKLVFIMRGLPGSGKTYVTKLIKDKETELGGDPPRILSLDDYFMTEVEKEIIDEDTGRKVKSKLLEYEYEAAVEPHYRGSLIKAFKKTISDGFFSFVVVDSVNEKTQDYEEMWSFAKQKGFQVYVAEMDNDVAVCAARNIHKRTEKEISELAGIWEETPPHYLRLDVRSLLQADAIDEVEMEVVGDAEADRAGAKGRPEERPGGDAPEEEGKRVEGGSEEEEVGEKAEEDEDEPGVTTFVKSRWDQFENSEQNLDRLDGLKRRREGFHATMEDYLQLPDDLGEDVRDSVPGKKRVRWADLEERRQQEKMRAIGFVVGQTDWSRMTDPTFGESALTRTKYI